MLDTHALLFEHGARLAKRGLEMTTSNISGGENVTFELPTASLAVIGTVVVFFALILTSVRYTLHGIVATLAMVEEPSTTLIVAEKSYSEKDSATEPLLADLETVAVVSPPITSSIRSAMHHLRRVGGFRARWRGLGAFLAWALPSVILRKVWMNLLSGEDAAIYDLGLPAAHVISSLIVGITFARFHMIWTRKVLAAPGTQNLWADANPIKTNKKLAVANIVNVLAWEVTIGLPIALAYATGLVKTTITDENMNIMIGSGNGEAQCGEVGKMVVVFGVFLISLIGVYVPSYVALIRTEASLLPAEVETIVPFDRTFGGRVVSEAEGGSGKLGYVEAWSSFTGVQRVRLLRLFGKILAVEVALHAIFGFAIASVLLALLRPDVFARVSRMPTV